MVDDVKIYLCPDCYDAIEVPPNSSGGSGELPQFRHIIFHRGETSMPGCAGCRAKDAEIGLLLGIIAEQRLDMTWAYITWAAVAAIVGMIFGAWLW